MNDESSHLPRLSDEDARLLDALVECGFDVASLALDGERLRRARAIMSLLGLAEDYPVEDADASLVDATLARIDRHERERSERLKVEAAAEGGGRLRRLHMPSLLGAAAVILIAASVALPVLRSLQQRSIDTRCENNMRWMNFAFSNYAADYGGRMPMARAGISHWAKSFENVINLAPLIQGGYCEHGHLNCPGHHGQAGSSYSYQWQSKGQVPRWGGPEAQFVLGDRNPLIDALRSGGPVVPGALSSNHAGRGQNVLTTNGSILWLDTATVKGDNIWMPRDGLHEGAATDSRDVFLAH